jgi:hypothetical protein
MVFVSGRINCATIASRGVSFREKAIDGSRGRPGSAPLYDRQMEEAAAQKAAR